MRSILAPLAQGRTVASTWWKDPARRRLRWFLLLSAAIQLALAPLTSWSSDTPGFVSGVVGMLYAGNPYASNLYFNPPLAPMVQAPGFVVLSRWLPAASWLHLDPSVVPAEVGTGMTSAILPDPAALLALKLPLILAVLIGGLLLAAIGDRWGWGPSTSGTLAAAWLLNPLVIWATAVHGEPDALAATVVLGALWVLQRGSSPLIAGLLLSLGFFDKLYPLLLAPPIFALLWAQRGGASGGSARRDAVSLLVGCGLGVLPFLTLLNYTAGPLFLTYTPQRAPVSYGGLSVVVLFNHQIATFGSVGDAVLPDAWGGWVHLVFVGLLILTMIAALRFAWLKGRSVNRGNTRGLPTWFVSVLLWIVVATLLNYPAPQPENLLAALPLMLLLGPETGSLVRRAFWILSLAGWALYLALLTPVAYFYPAAHLAGDGATPWMNRVVIAFHTNSVLPPTLIWTAIGVAGGLVLLAVWVDLARRVAVTPDPLSLPPGADRGVVIEAHD